MRARGMGWYSGVKVIRRQKASSRTCKARNEGSGNGLVWWGGSDQEAEGVGAKPRRYNGVTST